MTLEFIVFMSFTALSFSEAVLSELQRADPSAEVLVTRSRGKTATLGFEVCDSRPGHLRARGLSARGKSRRLKVL